jgi:GAF domain-containing protein
MVGLTKRKKNGLLFGFFTIILAVGGIWWYLAFAKGVGEEGAPPRELSSGEYISQEEQNILNDSRRRADLAIIRAALEAYRADNLSYPADLLVLEDQYLEEVPRDPATGESYFYRRIDLESYALSAVLSDSTRYTVTEQ